MGNQDSYSSGYRDGADGKPNLSLGVLYEEGWDAGHQAFTSAEGNQTFYVTFGSQYSREEHPQRMHPDGYCVIEAPDEGIARGIAFANFDSKWSMIYTADEFFKDDSWQYWYPRGELMRIEWSAHNADNT